MTLPQPVLGSQLPAAERLSAVVTQEVCRDQRLRILQSLLNAQAHLLNEAVLKRVLLAYGHAMSSDLVRTQLCWLEEQGLVDVSRGNGIQVARLSERGHDVATGAVRQPGVASPLE